jgi:hypothetical protein
MHVSNFGHCLTKNFMIIQVNQYCQDNDIRENIMGWERGWNE